MQPADVRSARTEVRGPAEIRWLILFHQIPPNPAYARVKIGRHLARIGAIGLKNAVYVLPRSDTALEDLHWVVREIVEAGGDATLCEARFVEGLADDDVERRFQEARDEDYGKLAKEIRELLKATPKRVGAEDDGRRKLEAELARLQRRFEEIIAIDFFHASGSQAVQGLLRAARERFDDEVDPSPPSDDKDLRERYRGRSWVTRTGVHVDRIASAWLVRRFIDAEARFKFVAAKGYRAEPGELRFDMFDAEFTHEGDRCTFEVLVERLSIREPGIRALAEIIHDIDLKDSKFARPETPGVAAAIAGLCAQHRADEVRLEMGFLLFDHLKTHFARRKT
ncbi:MAG TPA: chromate resistance protein ChrB domain-containing protein [Polyangiaceae bacterium]|jgi:hypothetical protein|nr:chromate resistance protein ChrB domain-containing protein [Polyangiaceae bacterium]